MPCQFFELLELHPSQMLVNDCDRIVQHRGRIAIGFTVSRELLLVMA